MFVTVRVSVCNYVYNWCLIAILANMNTPFFQVPTPEFEHWVIGYLLLSWVPNA